MKKNVASQSIGAQLIDATTGAAFTGAVTVYVTGDNGTQAVGSVGSGACTHEGNGYHSYAPAQAETNYDHIAFTFIGTGAIPATVQLYTDFPQTGDAFARVGAPVGASISADVAAVKTQTAAIEADTQDIQARIPAALVSGRIDASVGAMAANVMTAAAAASDLTTELQSGLATAAALATVDANVDAILVDTGTTLPGTLSTIAGYIDTEVTAIKAKTDNLPASPAAVSDIPSANANADALLDRVNGVESGYTLRQALRLMLSSMAAKLSGAATTTVTIRDVGDTKDRIVATVDADGNRSALTLDAS